MHRTLRKLCCDVSAIRKHFTNILHWIQFRNSWNGQKYVQMRRNETAEVRKAKNDWFQEKAKEI